MSSAAAGDPLDPLSAARLAGLRTQLELSLGAQLVPGAAAGIVAEDEQLIVCSGITNVDDPFPVDGNTVFEIASVTKTMTATVALRLVADGRLDLDAPVRRYLPEFQVADPVVSEQVTVGDLFTHTAGWVGEYLDAPGEDDEALARGIATMSTLRQIVPPGRHFSYNNVSLSVAGRIIEIVTGRTYEAAMAEILFGPLGMTRTTFFAADVRNGRLSAGHTVRAGAPVILPGAAVSRAGHPVGGVRSTIRDLLAYTAFHLGDGLAPDGTRLLPPGTLAQMRVPRFPLGPGSGWVGLSWMLADRDGTLVASHGGAAIAQMALLTIVPARSFGIVVLTNGANGGRVAGDLTRWALAEWLDLAPPPQPVVVPGPPDRSDYTGTYWSPLSDIDVVEADGDLVLTLRWKGAVAGRPVLDPAPLRFIGPDQVMAAQSGQQGDFIRDATGAVTFLRWNGRVRPRAS